MNDTICHTTLQLSHFELNNDFFFMAMAVHFVFVDISETLITGHSKT